LGVLLTAGAHFVIRFKDGVEHRILKRHKIPDLELPEGARAIRSDWTVLSNALPLQIVAAFVTDLLLRAFKHSCGLKGSLYKFVTTCRDISLTPIGHISSLREALLAVAKWLALPLALPNGKT